MSRSMARYIHTLDGCTKPNATILARNHSVCSPTLCQRTRDGVIQFPSKYMSWLSEHLWVF
jgi:hypothetical protein